MRTLLQIVVIAALSLGLAAQGVQAPAYLTDDVLSLGEPSLRFASQFPSIQAAIDSLPAAGGTVIIPVGTYAVTKCIDPGNKRVVLQGRGWRTTSPQAGFGDTRWPASVTGSVIRVAGNAGICISQQGASHLSFKELAIVGFGTPGSIGIDVSSPSTYFHTFENILVANLSVGLKLRNILDSDFNGIQVFGNETGIALLEVANELTFLSPRFEGNGIAMAIRGGSGVRCYGGLVQANRAGILFSPDSAPMSFAGSFEGMWFEANSAYDLRFEAQQFPVGAVTFRNNRHAGAGKLIQFEGSQSTNRIYFENLEAGGVELVIPTTSNNAKVDSSTFASITDQGQLTQILNDPIAGHGKLNVASLVANQSLEAKAGLSLSMAGDRPFCSSNNRGMLWMERGGQMVADRFSICVKTASDGYEWKDLIQ